MTAPGLTVDAVAAALAANEVLAAAWLGEPGLAQRVAERLLQQPATRRRFRDAAALLEHLDSTAERHRPAANDDTAAAMAAPVAAARRAVPVAVGGGEG